MIDSSLPYRLQASKPQHCWLRPGLGMPPTPPQQQEEQAWVQQQRQRPPSLTSYPSALL